MTLPTWEDLKDYFCTSQTISRKGISQNNSYYEDISCRRYNYSAYEDKDRFRLVFLKGVLSDPANKTLRRNGRFVWCRELKYEGRNSKGFRQVSFSVDSGKKRFFVAENNVLCLPSKTYVSNNRYFKGREKTFYAFSSVFGYKKTCSAMAKEMSISLADFKERIQKDNPYKPGTLVSPRLGYFYPEFSLAQKDPKHASTQHPCGIVLGPAFVDDYAGREFYRVRFGGTTYERVHPIQMEIINEV
tara:strand:+ start:914 stop:1645 length:732 start_codon:yes stop_codon:yes gene_type:complete